ncbi:hypothetical protein V8B97DRAFT_1947211 [Scleroderma yunnanense]
MRRRICSLASMLYKFTVQKFPTKLSWDILPFLHHFATLLTCDNNVDRKAKKVIAVTGSGAVEGIVPSCGELCRPVLVPAQLCRVPKLYFTENMEYVELIKKMHINTGFFVNCNKIGDGERQ